MEVTDEVVWSLAAGGKSNNYLHEAKVAASATAI